jgi:hypothetical protein
VAWQPDLPCGETAECQNDKKEWLILEFQKSSEERDQLKISQYMEDTYATQKFMLNGEDEPPVVTLKTLWPFLCTYDGFLNHFSRLMGFDLSERFQQHSA